MTSTRPVLARRLTAAAAGLVVVASLSTAPVPADASPATDPAGHAAPRLAHRQVLAISIDGLNVRALRRLGRAGAPNLIRLLRQGASTRNARAQVEQTVTLPNHTSMLTGRRIDASEGGHGVTWNYDRAGATVQGAAGHPVSSIFSRVHRAGGSTALFATESKFSLFERSWPRAISRSTIVQDGDLRVTRAVRRDLLRNNRAFTFLHLGAPDEAGHSYGWLSPRYLDAVRDTDHRLGILLTTLREHPRRLGDVTIVLTSDHGGKPGTRSHSDATLLDNYKVPFLVWGPGVSRGDLYSMNSWYADPGTERVLFDGTQPVRNGDLANLSAHLLGLRRVRGSLWGAEHRLNWQS